MNIKLVVSIILLVVIPFCSYAQNESAVAVGMINNLTVSNSKSVIIPGDNGVLNIYFEKKGSQNVAVQSIKLVYNGIRSSFQVGTNIAITQNGSLVFAQNNNKIYVHVPAVCKENLKITAGSVEYIYQKDEVVIKYKDKVYKFHEVVYDKDKSSFQVFDNGRYIKTVEMEK